MTSIQPVGQQQKLKTDIAWDQLVHSHHQHFLQSLKFLSKACYCVRVLQISYLHLFD